MISYVHYFANGSIQPLKIDAAGVGQYDATGMLQTPAVIDCTWIALWEIVP